jgi:hypothetical protein
VKSQRQIDGILEKLGFDIPGHGRPTFPVWHLIGYQIVVVIWATFVTTAATKLYLGDFPETSSINWRTVLGIPKTDAGLWLWSWKTALFYFSTAIAAWAIRQYYIARRRWFDVTSQTRTKPVFQYVAPILGGTLAGWAMLSMVILSESLGTDTSVSLYEVAIQAMQGAMAWVLLAMTISLLILVILDSDLRGKSQMVLGGRSLLCGLAAGVVGWIIAKIVEPTRVPEIMAVVSWFQVIKSSYIALFVFMLFWAVQFVESRYQKTRDFSGKSLVTSNNRGAQFTITLRKDGTALGCLPGNRSSKDEAEQKVGYWKQIPEGTVVLWRRVPDENPAVWGDLGILTLESGTAMYEGFRGSGTSINGAPDFVNWVQVYDA